MNHLSLSVAAFGGVSKLITRLRLDGILDCLCSPRFGRNVVCLRFFVTILRDPLSLPMSRSVCLLFGMFNDRLLDDWRMYEKVCC